MKNQRTQKSCSKIFILEKKWNSKIYLWIEICHDFDSEKGDDVDSNNENRLAAANNNQIDLAAYWFLPWNIAALFHQ